MNGLLAKNFSQVQELDLNASFLFQQNVSENVDQCIKKDIDSFYCVPQAKYRELICEDINIEDKIFNFVERNIIIDRNMDKIRLAYLIIVEEDEIMFANLLRVLWKPQHIFIVHIDINMERFRVDRAKETIYLYSNVYLLKNRFDGKDNGASLLYGQLQSVAKLLEISDDWDYLINLSEHDFPIKTNQFIEGVLLKESKNKTKNFISSSLTTESLKYFSNCDNTIGSEVIKLPEFKPNLYTSSQWFVLSKEFCYFMITNSFSRQLLSTFHFIKEPHLYFFATLLMNTKYNETVDKRDWHYEGWGRMNKKLWEKDISSFEKMDQFFVRKIYTVEMQELIQKQYLL